MLSFTATPATTRLPTGLSRRACAFPREGSRAICVCVDKRVRSLEARAQREAAGSLRSGVEGGADGEGDAGGAGDAGLWAFVPVGVLLAWVADVRAEGEVGELPLPDSVGDDTMVSRVLGGIVLALFVYLTVGTIILSAEAFFTNQREKKELAMLEQKLAGGVVSEGSPSSDGLNRQQRRVEKKMKAQQERADKKSAALAAKKNQPKGDNEEADK